MDHQSALRRLRSPGLLRTALAYAIFDRTRSDWFFDPIEIEYWSRNRDELVAELTEELKSPDSYSPRTAFAFFPPKNELCDRRMVYVQIKDLTVRYALAILFAEEIETEIHPQCFANRRAAGVEAQVRFGQDFASGGWAGFCAWQREQSESHSVLLRTDISAFYDSISHEYLVQAVCRHLALPVDCRLVRLLRRMLQIPVIYYSPSNDHVEGPAVMHQGLPIGDGVEGFLANILLKDVDDAMAAADATYGRYVDDIRLFGQNRQEVLHRLRILQEQLLRKGLNLNASKTRIAENPEQFHHLMSQNYGMSEYGDDEPPRAGLEVLAHIDQPFEAFSRTFSQDQELQNCDDARDFCKYLSANDVHGNPMVPITERRTWHVERLREVVVRWRGSTKHAGWLLVQTAVYRGVSASAQRRASETVLDLLEDDTVSAYSRYRMLHHLLKLRRPKNRTAFRFLDNCRDDARQRVIALIPGMLRAPAFELNLIAIYMACLDEMPVVQLRTLVRRHATKGCEPIRNALSLLRDGPSEAVFIGAADSEPDELPDVY